MQPWQQNVQIFLRMKQVSKGKVQITILETGFIKKILKCLEGGGLLLKFKGFVGSKFSKLIGWIFFLDNS